VSTRCWSALDTRTVDEEWSALPGGVEMRADVMGEQRLSGYGQVRGHGEPQEVARAVGDRLRSGAARELQEVCAISPAVAGHRIRSDELHAISWLLGLAQVPLFRIQEAELDGAPAAI
jgi:hypothetical protein